MEIPFNIVNSNKSCHLILYNLSQQVNSLQITPDKQLIAAAGKKRIPS